MGQRLVVGYGNTLREDDGFGPYVIRALAASTLSAKLCLLERQLLTVELCDELEQAEVCVFVDAATTGDLGAVSVRRVEASHAARGAIGHDLSPAQLLALTEQLTGKAPPCWLVTTRALSTELGEGLTDIVARVVPCAVECVLRLTEDCLVDPVEAESQRRNL